MSRWNMRVYKSIYRESHLGSVFFEIQRKNEKARAGPWKSEVIQVKSWLKLLDTYSYDLVIKVKSWLNLLDVYSYVNVHHCN